MPQPLSPRPSSLRALVPTVAAVIALGAVGLAACDDDDPPTIDRLPEDTGVEGTGAGDGAGTDDSVVGNAGTGVEQGGPADTVLPASTSPGATEAPNPNAGGGGGADDGGG